MILSIPRGDKIKNRAHDIWQVNKSFKHSSGGDPAHCDPKCWDNICQEEILAFNQDYMIHHYFKYFFDCINLHDIGYSNWTTMTKMKKKKISWIEEYCSLVGNVTSIMEIILSIPTVDQIKHRKMLLLFDRVTSNKIIQGVATLPSVNIVRTFLSSLQRLLQNTYLLHIYIHSSSMHKIGRSFLDGNQLVCYGLLK